MKKSISLFVLICISFGVQAQVNPTNPAITDNRIKNVVEEVAYFDDETCNTLEGKERSKCAEEAMYKVINANLRYPPRARDNGTQGKVIIQFIVEKDGSLSAFEILKNVADGCGQAALSAVQNLEKFVPAQLKNKPVRTIYMVPIQFRLH